MEQNKKKGTLFGRFNIIDLIIILLVICVAAFLLWKVLGVGGETTQPDRVKVVFFEEECPNYVPSHTNPGDPMLDGGENIYLGTVTGIEIDESQTYNYDEITGEMTVGPKEGYCSVYITGEVEGTLTSNGIVVDSTLYSVGHTMILHAGYGKYYLTIYSIEQID
jgi:hypothetical protein